MTETSELFYEALGRRLKKLRRKANMTQAELANAVGFSRTSITNIETARQPVRVHTLVQIAEVLGVRLTDLVPTSAIHGRRK